MQEAHDLPPLFRLLSMSMELERYFLEIVYTRVVPFHCLDRNLNDHMVVTFHSREFQGETDYERLCELRLQTKIEKFIN